MTGSSRAARLLTLAALGAAAITPSAFALDAPRASALAPATGPPAACPTDARRAAPAPIASGSRTWPAPLDRIIAFDAQELPLRTALERLAAAGGVRFSYSPGLLPLDQPVCIAPARLALGELLNRVLAGTGVAPVVAGDDQIVLAPVRTAAAADAPPELARPVRRLERVVVTGTAAGAPERSSPLAIAVLEGDALQREGTATVAQMLDAAVPGVWIWSQSPTSPLSRYGSLRGASSFGVSTPKVYLDGVEVANPLLLAQLDASRVQRIEVIRGPQGAALYGADAISGVVHIVTRHDGVGERTPAVEARASAGSAASVYADGGNGVLAQDHGLVMRQGTAARSASLAGAYSTIGAFVPGAQARQLLLNGGARWVGSRTVSTATLRFDDARTQPAPSPLLLAVDTAGPQRVRQYTLGGATTVHASERWTHSATAGIDGYRLSGLSDSGMPILSAADSALAAARGGADRGSLRFNSTLRLGSGQAARTGTTARSAQITLGLEHSSARERTRGSLPHLVARDDDSARDFHYERLPTDSTTPPVVTTWWRSTGLLAQGQLGWADRAFLSGGARLERVSGGGDAASTSLLPMLGASWIAERGAGSLKLRAAYGRGIRQARTVVRGATWMGGPATRALASLDPEEQSGVEVGLDLAWADRTRLQLTRFDQRASGLVQPVAVEVYEPDLSHSGPGGPSGPGGGSRPRPMRERIAYQLQNVGAIDNDGWELLLTTSRGPLELAATASLVDSRVATLASGYRGDLRPGDRMLEVPARTAGLTATWHRARWSISGTASRAWDWVNYDRVALAQAFAAASDSASGVLPPLGARLRDFWRTYPGVTRLGIHLSWAFDNRTTLTATGENLLGRQLGEPDNATVVPGRTISVGVRTGF